METISEPSLKMDPKITSENFDKIIDQKLKYLRLNNNELIIKF